MSLEETKQETRPPTSPETRVVAAPEKETKAPAMSKKSKKPSNETVLARARQMARAEKRKIWAALGFEGDFDEAKFAENVERLAASKSETRSATEVLGSKAKEVEAENARLKAKLVDAQKKLALASKELEAKKGEIDDVKIEHEIQREAAARGITDLDYATDLYRRAVKTAPEDQEPPAVAAFFEELKKDSKRKHLFGAVEVLAGPKEAQPQQIVKPTEPSKEALHAATPKPGGVVPPAEFDSTKLSQKEFRDHLRQTYAYAPGS